MTNMDVLEAFKQMSGLSTEDSIEQSKFADLAIALVNENLRDPNMQGQESILINVCAATVNYWYQLSKASSMPSGSFSSDGLSVSQDKNMDLSNARRLRDEWWSVARGLLKDSGDFYFSLTPEVRYASGSNQ